ncbi:MAG: HAD-IC family P-type ATPase, partial [Gammaproteobacteria bacterium]|nr:HAD-IC family P-type ATPase [Gammaproteobacteria bacterium]
MNAQIDDGLRDPVCGMVVTTDSLHFHLSPDDYYFCCAGCRTKFAADPDRYLNPDAAAPQPLNGVSAYICPMCPEVRSEVPAPCPTCGMALEPESVSVVTQFGCPMHPEVIESAPGVCPVCAMGLEPLAPRAAQDNPELAEMTRRLWIGLVFTVPIVLLAMGGATLFGSLSPRTNQWLQLVLSIPAVFWAGGPFLARAVTSVRTRNLNMFTLIGLGVSAAWAFSAAVTCVPAMFPIGHLSANALAPVYFEAAAVIIVLTLVGQVLELRARAKTQSAVLGLLELAPPVALRLSGADEQEVPVHEVRSGDRLVVRPGAKVPVDGRVIEGSSDVDESAMSGEAIPVSKSAGDAVIAGTVNGRGRFVFEAERVGEHTLLAQVVALVRAAQRTRPDIQRIADRVVQYFVPLVLAISAVAFLIWYAVGPEPQLTYALLSAVSVLIIACPCAVGLATPMSIAVGTARAAKL